MKLKQAPIIFKIEYKDNDKIKFKIIYQLKKYRATISQVIKTIFSPPYDSLARIESSDHPEADEYSDILYIWGLDDSRDDALIECSKEFFIKIKKSINKLAQMERENPNLNNSQYKY